MFVESDRLSCRIVYLATSWNPSDVIIKIMQWGIQKKIESYCKSEGWRDYLFPFCPADWAFLLPVFSVPDSLRDAPFWLSFFLAIIHLLSAIVCYDNVNHKPRQRVGWHEFWSTR